MVGPIELRRPLPEIGGADVYLGEDKRGKKAIVLRWPAGRLEGAAVPALAQLIDGLQIDPEVDGTSVLTPVVHGSVSTDDASVAYALPRGETLLERMKRGAASPVEALSGAMHLVEGLREARRLGVPVGRWSPDTVYSLEDGPSWQLVTPGAHTIDAGTRPRPRTVGEAAICAPEVATGAVSLRVAGPTDIDAAEAWAVGATLFYALTEEWPPMTDDAAEVCQDQLAGRVRDLIGVAPHLDRYRKLDALVKDCLQRAPQGRPQGLEELRDRLNDALREAERLDSDVAFLPARVSDTMEIRRARLRERTDEHAIRPPDRRVQFAALIMLVAILLFLLVRQTTGSTTAEAEPPAPPPAATVAPTPG